MNRQRLLDIARELDIAAADVRGVDTGAGDGFQRLASELRGLIVRPATGGDPGPVNADGAPINSHGDPVPGELQEAAKATKTAANAQHRSHRHGDERG